MNDQPWIPIEVWQQRRLLRTARPRSCAGAATRCPDAIPSPLYGIKKSGNPVGRYTLTLIRPGLTPWHGLLARRICKGR
eukprot:scaffold320111_cov30-Tisochrysis_lutea.AAC.2